jgi:acetyltransferase-like isoleucine patch superfamily enzyme
VAAHAVVTRDVEPCTLVGGVPARVIQRWDPDAFVPMVVRGL